MAKEEMKTIAIRIADDGQPIRDRIPFETGVLQPGEALEVPAWQADMELAQQTVVELLEGGEPPQPREEIEVKEPEGFLQ